MTVPRIELSPAEKDAFLQRMYKRADKHDFRLIHGMTEMIIWLTDELDKKTLTIRRLRSFLGKTSEKGKDILPSNETSITDESHDLEDTREVSTPDPAGEPDSDKIKKKIKGHGRNGAASYHGAQKVFCPHCSLKPGDPCPECKKGRLYELTKPGIVVRIRGQAPLSGTIYHRQRLRCNPCGALFVADLPAEAGTQKYDAKAKAMLVLLKYGSGFPLERMKTLHTQLGIPLPVSTQWDLIAWSARVVFPVYEHLFYHAAQGSLVHNDDTGAKVLLLIKENKEQKKDSERTGIFTTGIISKMRERQIALYFTGRLHAGENLSRLFQERLAERAPPIHMSDASSRNQPDNTEIISANCLVHGRRNEKLD